MILISVYRSTFRFVYQSLGPQVRAAMRARRGGKERYSLAGGRLFEGGSCGHDCDVIVAREDAMPAREDMPSTLKRSPKKAQDTFVKTHDSAVEEYGEGERAHRTAFSAVKHSFEKVGDHWEPKEKKGPSDAKAAGGRSTRAETAGGVDANASKQHLMDVAKRLDIGGRSRMTKPELVDAIQKANDRSTRKARGK
jgi:cation transport regulator ChaB